MSYALPVLAELSFSTLAQLGHLGTRSWIKMIQVCNICKRIYIYIILYNSIWYYMIIYGWLMPYHWLWFWSGVLAGGKPVHSWLQSGSIDHGEFCSWAAVAIAAKALACPFLHGFLLCDATSVRSVGMLDSYFILFHMSPTFKIYQHIISNIIHYARSDLFVHLK